ncbi:MAG: hypothetical protein ABIW82_02565 [Dokdonella sp.]
MKHEGGLAPGFPSAVSTSMKKVLAVVVWAPVVVGIADHDVAIGNRDHAAEAAHIAARGKRKAISSDNLSIWPSIFSRVISAYLPANPATRIHF